VKTIVSAIDKGKVMDEIKNTGAHATEADAVPGAPAGETQPAPPMQGATEADAVSKTEGVTTFIEIGDSRRLR
jgi:hypothetical protein